MAELGTIEAFRQLLCSSESQKDAAAALVASSLARWKGKRAAALMEDGLAFEVFGGSEADSPLRQVLAEYGVAVSFEPRGDGFSVVYLWPGAVIRA